jgi:UDP-3-O-[3-hydroxymyristoyl] glucosamine N-acyltransferase
MIKKIFCLEELAEKLHATYAGNKYAQVSGVKDLKNATKEDVSFLSNEKYTSLLKSTNAGIICVDTKVPLEESKNYLISEDGSSLFAKICELFIKDESSSGFENIHTSACIHPSAKIGKNVKIGPYSVIDRDVEIKDNTVIYSHVTVGPKSEIGKDCIIYANVVIREMCKLGDRVILQPSCVIGSCGFGYSSSKKTGVHSKIKQLGGVILQDDVEIGSGTTVDRGRFSDTVIRKGTKIDNQCMIAHNCDIGMNNLIVSMSGLSGSVKTGNNVIIAGQCGLVGHIEIADFVTLGARSTPTKSIKKPGGVYLGSPAQEISKELSELVAIKKLPEMLNKFKEAEKLLSGFTNSEGGVL